ncbi:hypothetical protein [Pteropox virus]|uniref:Uncharacterized protein n=1 Tax=Pteropox virus TaxID=1873698 RepID=A0A1B1MRD6_9POXV|nr:hypothetical protein [Pteropox virus]ANS71099.1 hypothetical protein [Pteropox virus]
MSPFAIAAPDFVQEIEDLLTNKEAKLFSITSRLQALLVYMNVISSDYEASNVCALVESYGTTSASKICYTNATADFLQHSLTAIICLQNNGKTKIITMSNDKEKPVNSGFVITLKKGAICIIPSSYDVYVENTCKQTLKELATKYMFIPLNKKNTLVNPVTIRMNPSPLDCQSILLKMNS